jgi:hypothetical protein
MDVTKPYRGQRWRRKRWKRGRFGRRRRQGELGRAWKLLPNQPYAPDRRRRFYLAIGRSGGLRSPSSLSNARHHAKSCEPCSSQSMRPPLRQSAHEQSVVRRSCSRRRRAQLARPLQPIYIRSARTGAYRKTAELLRPRRKQRTRPASPLIIRSTWGRRGSVQTSNARLRHQFA